MNPRLRDLYANVAIHATADREHEAVLDLLVLMLVADRHIDHDELDEIRSISEDSGFETSTFSFEQYEGQAVAKVRAAVAGGGVDALLDDIDARIANTVLRQALFSAARDVAGADDLVDATEESILGQVAARFG
ncbi:MAG: hypothetical protein FD127_403 [Acidimicrobiaceae bacterium]|jgi:hypothetical protein|nr:MAG: hypothetical protein FD127_403 [Acidimicrobiaceae bacterium]